MEWIKTTDKLPEDGEVILGLFDTKLIDGKESEWYKYPANLSLLRFYKKSDFNRGFQDKSSLMKVDSERVTHWMPIPKKP